MGPQARASCSGCGASFPVPDGAAFLVCPVCAGFRPNAHGSPSDSESTDLLVADEDRLVPSDHTAQAHGPGGGS